MMHLPIPAAARFPLLGCHRVLSCSEQPAQTPRQLLPENQQRTLGSRACALADLHEPRTALPRPTGSLWEPGQGTAPNTHLLLQAEAEGNQTPKATKATAPATQRDGAEGTAVPAQPQLPTFPPSLGSPNMETSAAPPLGYFNNWGQGVSSVNRG